MPRQTPLLLSAITFLGATLAPAPAALAGECKVTNYGTLPIEMRGARPSTLVKVNGRETRFLVDTGAFFGTMSVATAKELGLRLEAAPAGLYGVGVGGSFSLQVTRVKELGILGGTIPDIQFTVGGSDVGMPVLGANVLHAVDLELDLARGQMRLMKPKGCDKTAMAYWDTDNSFQMAELTASEGRRGRNARIKVVLNGKPVIALLDTGASSTVISRRAAERAGIDLTAASAVPGSSSMGFGRSTVKTWTVPVNTISIGTETIKRAKIQVLDGNFGAPGDDGPDMLLGIDFILAHRIFVASSQDRIYFTYNGGPVFASGIAAQAAQAAAAAGPSTTGGASALPPAKTGPAPGPAPAAALASAADHALRGNARVARGDLAGGIADLEAAVRLEPASAAHHAALGHARATSGLLSAALDSFDRALALQPDNLTALLARSGLRRATGNRAGALADADAARRLATPGTQASLQVAQLFMASDEPARALPLYDAWIGLHPDDALLPSVLNGRCWARALANQLVAGALEDCRRAIRRGGAQAAYLDSLGLVQLRLKDYAAAIASYQRALAKAPDNAWSRYGLGLARIRSGHAEAGQADLDLAAARDPAIAALFEKFGI